MKSSDQTPKAKYRKDYLEPDFWIDQVDLEFELEPTSTLVRTRLAVRRNDNADAGAALQLDGEELETLAVKLDGNELGEDAYRVENERLTISDVPDRFELETHVRINPEANTELSGLYRSSGIFCTQCEAEGFRRITWFVDRPDVMARYRVRLIADPSSCPVLLSNGNRVAEGRLDDGRHWVQWEDPHLKPSYLFALVAGDLRCHDGSFKTKSDRDVRLEIWVEEQNIDRCEHALESLKKAMRWDEDVFGLEYDLDLYMIVAVNDFNMGAMENKGLNIFNSKYVLALPETATDDEYQAIEAVIAHEYFHNWTGNRVTCRDWFQLTLKEGLTVFRDQQFSMDMWSAAVNRIDDVKALRTHQFVEDGGPMAHPIRPEFYIEMNNFYTLTVYEKGAEVVRMYQTLLGRDGFRKGMDLYFERHDGSAVTCDDFLAAMADASGRDLSLFARWYAQGGTPHVEARGDWDAEQGRYTLTLRQKFPTLPKLDAPEPALMPIEFGLIGESGQDLPLCIQGQEGDAATTRVLELDAAEKTWVFDGIAERPAPSVLRGFSAPVILEMERDRQTLAFLAAHDSDPFNRWDAGQTLAQDLLVELAHNYSRGEDLQLDPILLDVFAKTLDDAALDGSMKALALALPPLQVLVQQLELWDYDAVYAAREFAKQRLAEALHDPMLACFEAMQDSSYRFDAEAVDRRRLKNRLLDYLAVLPDESSRVLAQFEAADNMSDRWSAFQLLCDFEGSERDQALEAFYERWHDDPLVLDKWFRAQACSTRHDCVDTVASLVEHKDFTLKNPNRARSLIGAFGMMNPLRFHDADGRGYSLLADNILALDTINGQVASRVVSAFNQWRKFDEKRQALQRAQLERIAAKPKLSKDVFEIVQRALND